MRLACRAVLLASLFSWPLGLAGAQPALAADLAGTSWHLVKIVSMDNRVDLPDDPAKYTLEFQAEGKAVLQADCNRGRASWGFEPAGTSPAAGQLHFGPIAATRARCRRGSLSAKYLTQFEGVRSYVIEDGHLILATVADGAILEFAPAGKSTSAGKPASTAMVLDEELQIADATELQQTILTRLFDRYAADRAIEVKPEETDAFVERMRRGMAELGLTDQEKLSPAQEAEADEMRRRLAYAILRQWKINKALYDDYGGRIIYQQLGPEPLDAYRQFLEQRQEEGAFAIRDKALAARFWRYFTDESIHDFMAPDGPDAARAFSVPPWEYTP